MGYQVPSVNQCYDFSCVIGQLQAWCCSHAPLVQSVYDECKGTSLSEQVAYLFGVVRDVVKAQQCVDENFKTLYDFVKDFFENLDLQEEVNNYLDNLADTLGYISRLYKSTSDLINSNISSGVFKTMCYSTMGDNGGATFQIVDEKPATFSFNMTNGKFLKLIPDKYMSLSMFGFASNNTDDSDVLQSILTTCKNSLFLDMNHIKCYAKNITTYCSIKNANIYGVSDTDTHDSLHPDNPILILNNDGITVSDSFFYGSALKYSTGVDQYYGYFAIKAANLKNICIKNVTCSTTFKYAIYLDNCEYSVIDSCDITDAKGSHGDGIFITSSHDIAVKNCTATNCDNIGIVCEGVAGSHSYNISYINNIVTDMQGGYSGEFAAGLWMEHTDNGYIINNTISNCKDYGMRINVTETPDVNQYFVIEKNVFSNNSVSLDLYSYPAIVFAKVIDNTFIDSTTAISIRLNDVVTVENNIFSNNTIDIYTDRETGPSDLIQIFIDKNRGGIKMTCHLSIPILSIKNTKITITCDKSDNFSFYANNQMYAYNCDITYNGSRLCVNDLLFDNCNLTFNSECSIVTNTGEKITNSTITNSNLLYVSCDIINSILNNAIQLQNAKTVNIKDSHLKSSVTVPSASKLIMNNCYGGNFLNVASGGTASLINCVSTSTLSVDGTLNKNNLYESAVI